MKKLFLLLITLTPLFGHTVWPSVSSLDIVFGFFILFILPFLILILLIYILLSKKFTVLTKTKIIVFILILILLGLIQAFYGIV